VTQVVAPTNRLKGGAVEPAVLLLIVWLAMVIGFSLISPIFFSVDVAANILRLGAAGAHRARPLSSYGAGIDLSVGATVGFSGVIGASR
jgi:ribose/xylose/arabinose/galactoside ABC-type transport system permease subunit